MALDPDKRVRKICNNNTETKKGQDGCNISYKFDYIWKCLIHNVNFLTKNDELDLCGYETSWATYSSAEAGSVLTGRIANNPGLTKCGQTVLVSDVHHIRPHAYKHRHKLHVKPPGYNVWGKVEFKEIMEAMKLMVEGEDMTREKYSVNTHTQNGKITSVGVR